MPGEILAGASKADVTPIDLKNVFLAGFGNNRRATHVLDPIFARALYLSDGRREFAIVVFDLIGLMTPFTRRLRESVGEIDPAGIWVACTHSHSAPDTLGLWGPGPFDGLALTSGVDKRYLSFLVEETRRLVSRAKRLARPATFHFGLDKRPKGHITYNIRDQKIMDHDLGCMAFLRSHDGRAIAMVTNYGSHPESLWENNTGISPDYLAHYHRAIENAFGGTSIFLNGALGGMVTPGISMDASLKERLPFYKKYGEELAEFAISAANSAQKATVKKIGFSEKPLLIPIQNDHLSFAGNFGVLNRELTSLGVESSIGVLSIGPARFLAAPGEVLPELGLELKSIVGGDPSFLISLCNDELGYLLPSDYFDDENYEYEQSMSPGRSTAEILKKGFRSLVG